MVGRVSKRPGWSAVALARLAGAVPGRGGEVSSACLFEGNLFQVRLDSRVKGTQQEITPFWRIHHFDANLGPVGHVVHIAGAFPILS